MRRAAILLLASGVLATSGCCGWVYRPFGPGTLCDTSNCVGPPGGPVYGPPGGPACGPTCGPGCDSCGEAGGPPCGGPCGDPYWGPFAWRFPLLSAILHPFRWGGCRGCGELYLGDFHGDPPDGCDPCDNGGNWTGGGWMGGPPVVGDAGDGAPVATCPTCGAQHAATWSGPGYVVNPSPPGISPAENVVQATPSQRPSGPPAYVRQTATLGH